MRTGYLGCVHVQLERLAPSASQADGRWKEFYSKVERPVAREPGGVYPCSVVVGADVPLYSRIGERYARGRREDPRIASAIWTALGDAITVVNVGAGAGSYEPADRRVVAVEPSAVMLAQRRPEAAPAVRASAERLPLPDQSFDCRDGGAQPAPLEEQGGWSCH